MNFIFELVMLLVPFGLSAQAVVDKTAATRAVEVLSVNDSVPSKTTVPQSDKAAEDSIFKTIGLEGVVITAPVRETYMRGDTTVINAEAIKTPEGAYLEDLVKRIPGLVYDSRQKTLTYNGRPINEINVNGKQFLGGDKKMALENLPAEIIGKIKVYDKRSELEKITKVRSGAENYVLDLQTKRQFNGSLIAFAEAGRGNHGKKNYSASANIFKENGESFSLMAGTGNRSMTTDYPKNKMENLSVNLYKNIAKDFSVYGNVMFNNTVSGNETSSYNEQYLTTGNQYLYSAGNSSSNNRNLNANIGAQWKLNDRLFININGNLGHSSGSSDNDNRQSTYTANPGLSASAPFAGGAADTVPHSIRLNDTRMNGTSKNDNDMFGLSADITKVLNDHGTSISMTAQVNSNKSSSRAFNLSETTYYKLQNALGGDSVMNRSQFINSPSTDRSASFGLMFTQPLFKGLTAQLSYRYSMSRQNSDRSTYDLAPFGNGTDAGVPGDLPDGYERGYVDSLSNHSQSRTNAHEFALNLNYADSRWNVGAGLTVRPEHRTLDQKTGLMQADTVRNSMNLMPTLSVTWTRNQTSIDFRYSGSTQQPSLSDLLSLTDNSDPLNITRGNPALKASYTQNFQVSARNFDVGFSGDASFTNTYNSQTQAVIYNMKTGGRETYPVNISGNWNARASLNYMKRFLKHFSMSAGMSADFSQSVGLVNEGQHEQPDRSETGNTSYNGNLHLGYNPQWGGFDLSGNWRYNHSSNKLRNTDDYTRDYNFRLDAYAELPVGLQLRSDASYSFRNGTNINPGDDDQVLWNMSLTWRFLKKRSGELTFSWTDILSDKKSFYRNVTSSGLNETHSRQIGGYVMLSFRYRFNKQL